MNSLIDLLLVRFIHVSNFATTSLLANKALYYFCSRSSCVSFRYVATVDIIIIIIIISMWVTLFTYKPRWIMQVIAAGYLNWISPCDYAGGNETKEDSIGWR